VFQKVRSELPLILTDVIMPGKNGRILSEELLQLELGLRVLFMTGYSRDAFASDLNRHIELLQNGASAMRRFRNGEFNPGIDIPRASVEMKLTVADPPDYLRQDMTVSVDVKVAANKSAASTLPQPVIGPSCKTPCAGGTMALGAYPFCQIIDDQERI
jgi:CheY-like chemotaxis protein